MKSTILNDDLIARIIKMDGELDKDPGYKKYERIFATQKIRESIGKNFNIAAELVTQEMVDSLLEFGQDIAEGAGKNLTPELVVEKKSQVIEIVEAIISLTNLDEEYELSQTLKVFLDLLKQI
jgi:hypothetical protein